MMHDHYSVTRIFVVIIVFYSRDVQVYCQNRELEIPFNVIENGAEVERIVLDETKTKFLKSCKYVHHW